MSGLRQFVSVISTLMVAAACDDRAGDPDALPRETFVRGVVQAGCQEVAACSDPAETPFSSVERCLRLDGAAGRAHLVDHYPVDGPHYDENAAHQCLQWLDARRPRCAKAYLADGWREAGSPCALVFGGWRKAGEVCNGSSECAHGRCEATQPCGKGLCVAARAIGTSCVALNECGFGMVCGVNGRCRPYREPIAHEVCDPGESCGPEATCVSAGICWPKGTYKASCTLKSGGDDPLCSVGWQCNQAKNGVCLPAKEPGDACNAKKGCPAGLVCADGSCAHPASNGQPCSKDRVNCTGADRACRPGASGKLICAPLPEAGQPCLAPGDAKKPGQRCTVQHYCDPASGLCQPWYGHGQPCATPAECKGDTVCFGGKCLGNAAIGAACSVDNGWSCGSGAWCKAGSCVPRGTLGEACDPKYSSCQGGLRCDGNQCAPQSQKGGPCASSSDCADGLACTGLTCVPKACP